MASPFSFTSLRNLDILHILTYKEYRQLLRNSAGQRHRVISNVIINNTKKENYQLS
jgi:hypothetical protein